MARRKKKHPMRQWGSPIELLMRNALCGAAAGLDVSLTDYSTAPVDGTALIESDGYVLIDSPDWLINDEYFHYGTHPGSHALELYASVRLLTYRVDLLLVGDGLPGAIAIECDGHEWHERTKQQASADRARDRELLSAGIPTLRFTGSDIHHYASDHAVSALRFACKWIRQCKLIDPFTLAEAQHDASHRGMRAGALGIDCWGETDGILAGVV